MPTKPIIIRHIINNNNIVTMSACPWKCILRIRIISINNRTTFIYNSQHNSMMMMKMMMMMKKIVSTIVRPLVPA